jgi:LEA14-like dessication related protein
MHTSRLNRSRLIGIAAVAMICSAFLLLNTACTSLSSLIEKPTASLQGLTIKDPTTEGATFVFALLVENPNKVALEVDELAYDLEVSGKQLTSGKLDQGAHLPANGSATIDIPVAVKYSDLFSSVLQLLKAQSSPYRLKGSARIGPFSIPFEKNGDVKLPRAGI